MKLTKPKNAYDLKVQTLIVGCPLIIGRFFIGLLMIPTLSYFQELLTPCASWISGHK